MLIGPEEASGPNWGPRETKEGDSRGQGKARERKGFFLRTAPHSPMASCLISVSLTGGAQQSHPFPLSLPASDTECPANLSSSHEDSRADVSLSNSAALMNYDPALLRGPGALSPVATLLYLPEPMMASLGQLPDLPGPDTCSEGLSIQYHFYLPENQELVIV